MTKCDECQHCFKPKMTRMGIREVRDRLRECTSQSVWVVHNGRRYRLQSFGRTNFSWSGWCYTNGEPMTLSDMCKALDRRDNWEHLDNYRLAIHIETKVTWVNVFRVEETLAFYALEDDVDLEDIEGEVLIHVHSEDDVLRAYEESQR